MKVSLSSFHCKITEYAFFSFFFYLQWDTGLDRNYSGLILRFDLTCTGNYTRVGCLLVKSKGNYSLSGIR